MKIVFLMVVFLEDVFFLMIYSGSTANSRLYGPKSFGLPWVHQATVFSKFDGLLMNIRSRTSHLMSLTMNLHVFTLQSNMIWHFFFVFVDTSFGIVFDEVWHRFHLHFGSVLGPQINANRFVEIYGPQDGPTFRILFRKAFFW